MSSVASATPAVRAEDFAEGVFARGRLDDVVARRRLDDLTELRTVAELRRSGDRHAHLRLSRSAHLIKRIIDLLGATVLLILSAPLLALAAVAIRLEGPAPGPVFFRQTRVGRDGRPFRIVKLRTMVVGADELKEDLRALNEAVGLFKIADDPRITRVGGVLRKTCIDELPQLLNVLRGEMSLVGPRPLVPEEDCQVRGWHRARLHTAPGMTGHWQVLGAARIPLAEMVAIDCRYIATWTIWGDIKTLAMTIPCVLARRGI
jgi:lipopolysaccharide/colanic/teichoic acid biosynthesis glycosyltransferase